MTDGLLVAAFGGPQPGCCGRRTDCNRGPGCESPCFVSGILGDDPAQAGRVAEVVGHYRHFGGFSPYNRLAAAQTGALQLELQRRGRPIRLELGFRHWSPWIGEACSRLDGCQRIAGLVLAPHAAARSTEAYRSAATLPGIAWTSSFHDHPGMAAAVADRLREATQGWSTTRLADAVLLFTAHAIPQPAERASGYRSLVETSAALAAAAFGKPAHRIAYQSAPTTSAVPWSTPQILQALDACKADGVEDVLVQPIGFLIDHIEVLYDLDIEAQLHAQRLGLRLTRAGTVGEHPSFVSALADVVDAALGC
jgi:protoporphyrin/coproporphyrin ferrochelatase